jgi:hypothetical protein
MSPDEFLRFDDDADDPDDPDEYLEEMIRTHFKDDDILGKRAVRTYFKGDDILGKITRDIEECQEKTRVAFLRTKVLEETS